MHDPADLAYFAALDRRLVEAVRGIRLLEAISWPASAQRKFLSRWQSGRIELPKIDYAEYDYSAVREELDAIQHEARAAEDHPIGGYVRRTAESWEIATRLLESVGTRDVAVHSAALFGKPGDFLPGSDYHNIDAARHFIDLADELSKELATVEADYVISAGTMQEELQDRLDAFFVHHHVRVEIDPKLTAKAAAGTTRIRLRADTGFTEYDRHQLLEHEAFVHSLTALNGRAQPHLASMARNSPRITATQEGLAVFSELVTGSIDIMRMKRISLRILAIDMALRGANFIEVFSFFLEQGQSEAESFTSAMRVFRGAPTEGGSAFTKDTVYLHGLLSVHTFFRWALRSGKLELAQHLFAGKMTLQDVVELEPFVQSGFIDPPMYLPPWMRRTNGLAGYLSFSLFVNRIRLDQVEREHVLMGV